MLANDSGNNLTNQVKFLFLLNRNSLVFVLSSGFAFIERTFHENLTKIIL